jgi:Tfp pilus assembly protein PilN
MIKVNLLPPEYRKVDGTPVARFAALVIGVFLTASAMSVWGYVHFGMLAEVRDRRADLEDELVGLNKLAERSQALLAEYKEYQKRRQTIEEVDKGRILWSRKLDQFADLIHNKGDSKRHLVWLSDVRTKSSRNKGSGGVLTMSGWSAGEELARLSDFNKDVRQDEEFFADFQAIDPPRGERVAFGDGRVPELAWRFTTGLDLKAPGWREKQ